MLALFLPILLFYSISVNGHHPPIVSTHLGKIQGHHQKSFNQRTFSAFEGIPYAKPPTGNLRFGEPEPIEKWNGIWNATNLYTCAQFDGEALSGNEDCLYLNIYVPRTHIHSTDNLDVIVHIHGGGNMAGSGHFYSFPGYLMDHDVIFITFNYRLGILGFLSTEDEALPGNMGMKDQVMALKWIKDHIRNFGGNPNSVTITGFSSGAVSVQLHYMSPLSRGLFQRGFSESGCVLNPFAIQRGALEKTKKLGTNLGCPQHSNKDLVDCLKKKTQQEILNQTSSFYGYKLYPYDLFGPVVEKGRGAFLKKEPYELLLNKEVEDLPWMASFVSEEAGISFPDFASAEVMNKDWKIAAPYILYYNFSQPRNKWDWVAEKSLEFYLGKNKKITRENYFDFVKLNTDRQFLDGIVKCVDLQSKATHKPVYIYELSYTGNKTMISHGDDTDYFFYYSAGPQPTEETVKMVNIMVKMLVSYAKTNIPKVDGIDWKSVKPNNFQHLNISGPNRDQIRLQSDKNMAHGDFWDSLGFLFF